MWGEHLASVTLYRSSQLVLSKTIRIGDTRNHIYYSLLKYTLLLMITRRIVIKALIIIFAYWEEENRRFVYFINISLLFLQVTPPWVKANIVHTIELPTSIPNCLVG